MDGDSPLLARPDRSEASKRDILRFYRIPAEKITVAYNAIDERFNREPVAEDIARAKERFQLHDPFVLYVGNIRPHKNIERLIEAFALVRTGPLANTKLLIIGDEISKYPTLRRAVHQGNCTSTCGSWDSWATRRWRRCTGSPPCSRSRRSTRASACRRSRRWPAARRS